MMIAHDSAFWRDRERGQIAGIKTARQGKGALDKKIEHSSSEGDL